MISLAETPRKININNPRGPYNIDGKNKEKPTDDKPFVHIYNGKYYLSWGCFYAVSDDLYGPYDYRDCIMKQESFADGYGFPTWPEGFYQGRHGSFFEWHNQWYYAYCDISQTGNRYFRDTFISYVHYKENGEMATIRVDGIGVGQYESSQPKIEAEDYFKSEGFTKKDLGNKGFSVVSTANKSYLNFPNINRINTYSKLELKLASDKGGSFNIEIRKDSLEGKLISSKAINLEPLKGEFKSELFPLSEMENKENLYFLITQNSNASIQIDGFKFIK